MIRGLVILAVIALVAVPVAISFFTPPFDEATLAAWDDMALELIDDKPATDDIPYRTGKVAALRYGTWEIHEVGVYILPTCDLTDRNLRAKGKKLENPTVHDVHGMLPDDVRADSVDEVDTVVFCSSKKVNVKGIRIFYIDTGGLVTVPSFSGEVAQISVYDVKNRMLIGHMTLRGSEEEIARFISEKMPVQ